MEKKLHHQFRNAETLEAIALPTDLYPTVGVCILHIVDCYGNFRDWEYCGCGMW